MLRKLFKSFYTFLENLSDSINLFTHLRCEKHSVILLNQCSEVLIEMLVDKIIKGEIRSFDKSFAFCISVRFTINTYIVYEVNA